MRVTLNGRPFDPDDFQEALMKSVVDHFKEQLHERISGIRDPATGEFPVVYVSGTTLENVSARIDASAELLAIVRERLSPEDLTMTNLVDANTQTRHTAFLSFGWEDREMAEKIATALQESGINVWWAEWEIRAGDSLRQKIDEGLRDCTDFLVLLTPESIKKPWVNQEIDAGLVRKIESQARFIPIRHDLPVSQLPPLLKGMLSPALEHFELDIRPIINDILGITRKPRLRLSSAIAHPSNPEYSQAATAVAAVFIEGTTNATNCDPMLSFGEICDRTSLAEDDLSDALHELSTMIDDDHGILMARTELFVTFDKYFKGWEPAADALVLAADLLNDAFFPREPAEIAQRYGWQPRRLNPAIGYLLDRKLIDAMFHLGMGPWIACHLERTDATRRFVKSRQ